MILVIGNSGSYETSAFNIVLSSLRDRGHEAVLFKQDKCLESDNLLFKAINGIISYFVIIDGKRYSINDFSGIWYMHPHLPLELLNFEPSEYRQLIHRQFDTLRQAVQIIFRNKKWLNDPIAIQIAENKLYQLLIAAKIGFSIPDTITTSNPDEVRHFYKKYNGKIITKLLAASPVIDRVIYTNKVSSDHMSKIDSVKQSPAIFQEMIPKLFEIRITVVGKKIFPIKIYSQSDKQTSLDWRRKPLLNDFAVKMEPMVLPKEIRRKIFILMEELSLQFGCIDMIVTPNNDYVFLEINPNGQWCFIQLKTGVQIAEAIADLLV